MSEVVSFRGEDASEYSIRILDGAIELDWFYRGSMYGGFGTEGGITVGEEKVPEFLKQMNFDDLPDLVNKIRIYDGHQWSNLKKEMRGFSTGSWNWADTD